MSAFDVTAPNWNQIKQANVTGAASLASNITHVTG